MEHSFPRVLNYPSQGPKHCNNSRLGIHSHLRCQGLLKNYSQTEKPILYQHLLVPQTMSLIPKWKRLTLNVVHFHDTFIAHSYKEHSDELIDTLMQLIGSVIRGHTVEIKHHSVPLEVCDACTAAFNKYTHV